MKRLKKRKEEIAVMGKKFLIVILAVTFLVFYVSEAKALTPLPCGDVLLGGFPEVPAPDGFILGMGGVYANSKNVKVGDVICVRFTLMHNSPKVIKFDSNGVFVGARWNSTTDTNNRDFGHQFRNYSWNPQEKFINFMATRLVDKPGVWRFWPAYHINGHYGQFRWHEVVVNVSEASSSNMVVLGTFPQDTSADGLRIIQGEVKGPANPKVGDTIQVRFILKNVSGHTIQFDSNGVFVGARWNSTTDANNRDFGHIFRGQTRHNMANAEVKAQIKVDRPGTWRFWPAYHINGHYGPFRWHEVVVNVR